ncbi:hypothetical protein Ctob_015704, partial [Chrysochromulina tobinii]
PKKFYSRGPNASVAPGGQGFTCPPNCGAFFDTADEAIKHGKEHFSVIGNGPALLIHEAQHIKGDAADFTGFKCPEASCTFKDPKSAAVWAHAAEAHGIEEDTSRCLWVGACCAVGAACRCGAVFKSHHAKQSFATHQKKCQMGAAPLPASAAAANLG